MNIGDVLPTLKRNANGEIETDDAGNPITVEGSYYLKVNLPPGVNTITLARGQIVTLRRPDVFFNTIIERSKDKAVVARAKKQLAETPKFVQLKADVRIAT